jgi:hypothetical protein
LAALFATQGAISIEQEALSLLQGVNVASVNYRRLEAERILQRTLPAWQRGELPLSLTEFVLLHDYLQEAPTLVNQTVGTLMLRSAFEYGQFIEAWWNTTDAYRQWLACDHAVSGGGEAATRALTRLKQLVKADSHLPATLIHLRQNLIEHVAERLLPPSALTAPALELLDSLLERPAAWPAQKVIVNGDQAVVDTQLAMIAAKDIPQAEQAIAVIGHARRTEAVAILASQPDTFRQLMLVREAAGSLPTVSGLSIAKQWWISLRLGLAQLLRHPLNSFLQYDVAAVGSVLGMAWLVNSIYPDLPSKTLNVIGLGLLYGVLCALGLWTARHIANRLRVLWIGWRMLVAMLVGGAIMAWMFTLFNQTLYDETLDLGIALASGVMFVAGGAISVRWAKWLQVVCSVASIMLALLVPFAGYLRYYEGLESFAFPTTPIVFDAFTVIDAVPTALIVAVLITLGLVLGAQYFPEQATTKQWKRELIPERVQPAVRPNDSVTRIMPDADTLDEHNSVGGDSDQTPATKVMPPPF